MELHWVVAPQEQAALRDFVVAQRNDPFVRYRIRHNVEQPLQQVTLAHFWEVLVGCLLTSQQRSGPDSPVVRFISQKPFPLAYDFFCDRPNAQGAAADVLTRFGGIRFTQRIPQFLMQNFRRMEDGLWQETQGVLQTLIGDHAPHAEREAAAFVNSRFAGFGPKQARNLLRGLGLTQYEIPIDSRITRWLNDFGFPARLTASALSDPAYYDFVMDGVLALCAQCDILPCVLDAAIFASYDGDGWTDENVVW